MKVINLVSSVASRNGGVTTVLINLINTIPEGSCDVRILSVKRKNEVKRNEKIYLIESSGLRFLDSIKFLFKFREMYDKDTKVIFHGLWCVELWLSMIYCRIRSIKYCIFLHGMISAEAMAVSRIKKCVVWNLLIRKIVSSAESLVVNSTLEHESAKRYFPSDRYFILGYALKSAAAQKNVNSIHNRCRSDCGVRFVILGRIDRIKRIEESIKLFYKLGLPDSSLLVAGDGDVRYLKELRIIVGRLGLVERVHFLGFLEEEERNFVLEKGDILLLLSERENFGMVVPEALSYGMGVVTSENTPWKELEPLGIGVTLSEEMLKRGAYEKVSVLVKTRNSNRDFFRLRIFDYLEKYSNSHFYKKFCSLLEII